MSDWRYKWVSARSQGSLDVEALTRAAKRGWVPVPFGQEPATIELPCEYDKLDAFMLHRMPEDKAQEREAELAFLNEALADQLVMIAIAAGNISQHIADLRSEGTEVSPVWDNPDAGLPTDALFSRKVKVAYDFLHSRGLA